MMRRIVTIGCLLLITGASAAQGHEPPEEEIAEYDEEVARSPESAEAYLKRAGFLVRMGHFQRALGDLRTVESRIEDPHTEPEFLWLRGKARAALGDDRRALTDLTAYIQLTGGTSEAHRLRGRIHERQDRLEAALADYEAALSFDSQVQLYISRGRIHRALGRLDDAAEGFAQGLRETGAALLRKQLVEVERERGNYERALELIDEGLEEADAKARWYLRRGEILEAAGRSEAAEGARKRALREAERLLEIRRSPAALATRGEAHLALGQLEAAIADLERAAKRAPQLDRARRLLQTARHRHQRGK